MTDTGNRIIDANPSSKTSDSTHTVGATKTIRD